MGGLVCNRLLAAGMRAYGSTLNNPPRGELARHPNFFHLPRFDAALTVCRKEALQRIGEECGRLDCLVLAVGNFLYRPTSQTTQEELESLYLLNAAAPFALACEAEPLLFKSPSPKIIFFADAAADSLAPRKLVAGYAASKTGLLILAKSLAYEWRDLKIKIAVIGVPPITNAPPGLTQTVSAENIADLVAGAALGLSDESFNSGDLLEIK